MVVSPSSSAVILLFQHFLQIKSRLSQNSEIYKELWYYAVMKRIYLDYAATSPLKPQVLEAMLPYLKENFGNPGSIHAEGQKARAAIDSARQAIANFLECQFDEIIFTGGGTEAINLALFGVLEPYISKDKIPHVIITSIEHAAVLNTLKNLETKKLIELTPIKSTRGGIIKTEDVQAAIRENTVLVSVMFVNNEIGTIQPVKEIGRLLQGKKIYFHVDAVQAAECLDIRPQELNADLLTISPHKFGGPKGAGILYKRLGTQVSPVIFGGGQELGYRSGTENVAGIVGVAKAFELIGSGRVRAKRRDIVARLRGYLTSEIKTAMPESLIIGEKANLAPHIIAIAISGVNAAELAIKLDLAGVAISPGSACSSGAAQPSRVFEELNLPKKYNGGLLRFSISEKTTREEIKEAVRRLGELIIC